MQIIRVICLLLIIAESSFCQSFQFAAMSDSRGSYKGVNKDVLQPLINHMLENYPELKFVVFAGDLVDGSKTDPNSTRTQLQNWKEIMKPVYDNPNMIWPKLWVVVGNHEIQHRNDEQTFRDIFPNVFINGPDDEKGISYSFDFNNAHFTFVTSDRWYYGKAEDTTDDRRDWHYIKNLDWLENDLATAKKRGNQYLFVISHEPCFPVGGHLRDALPNLGLNLILPLDSTRQWYLNQRNRFWEIMKKYDAAAYICGHEHLYGRESVEGIFQIIAGSSGAPLYYFNPKYGEDRTKKISGMEMTYEEALPYFQVLKYFYGPGENSQASKDFFGLRAFEYVVFDVKPERIKVTTIGEFPVDNGYDRIGKNIRIIDEFQIIK